MKVKCIDIGCWKDRLTIGKTYEVIYEDNNWYWIIIDDIGDEKWFPKRRFTLLSEIRNDTINKLLEDES